MALSGCFGADSNGSTSTSTATTQPSSGTPTQTTSTSPTPDVRFHKDLQLTNCTSWLVLVTFPAGMAPGEPPSGWQPASPLNLISRVVMREYHCNRIAVGPYERGPVNLLLEAHTNATFPPECVAAATTATVFQVVSSVWIDDADIAGYLNSTMGGLPIRVTQFQGKDQATGPLMDRTWQWGSPPSTLTIHDDQRYEPHDPWQDRFFWSRGSGIGMLQIDADGPGAAAPYYSRPVEGTMQPPMLLSSLPNGRFAGDSQWQPSLDGTGVFTFFKDKTCQDPEPQP